MVSQLIAFALARSPQSLASSSQQVDTLMSECHDLLSLIQNRPLADLTHELSRANSIFPAMHGLILGAAAIVYLGGSDSGDIQLMADALASNNSSFVHPCVREALKVLSRAEAGNPETRCGLMQCCFLLPRASKHTNSTT